MLPGAEDAINRLEKMVVDPRNADIVYVPNVAISRSKDGGRTWVALRGSPQAVCFIATSNI